MVRDRMRCVVEEVDGHWQAYCVDVDVHTEGRTAAEARAALDRRLERYCYELDEHSTGTRQLPPAPLTRRVRYWLARVRSIAGSTRTHTFRCACYTFHAPPQVVMGLA